MVDKLIGTWVTDSTDIESIKCFGQVTLEFTKDGHLTYTIHNEEKDQKIFLIYKVKDDVLITDQPSNPQEEKTPFLFTSDGKLVLIYDGYKTKYVKEQK